MALEPEAPHELAQHILQALEEGVLGSTAQLRGSLAEDRADPYSDIDVLWEVPDADFQQAVEQVRGILSSVHPVESLRSIPELQRSDRRRLLFVRFADVPLFWRLDLDLFAASVGRDAGFDLDNPAARGSDWSPTESALANAVAAIKAQRRGQDENARELLKRGYERVRTEMPEDEVRALIVGLARAIGRQDASQRDLAHRVERLAAP